MNPPALRLPQTSKEPQSSGTKPKHGPVKQEKKLDRTCKHLQSSQEPQAQLSGAMPKYGSAKKEKILDPIHESLYDTLKMLQFFYSTPEKFNEILKKDMFAKNNSEAFQQVIYYLLKVHHGAEVVKRKVPSWPIYDKKMELHFRKEVIVALDELATSHPEAQIPKIAASQLISPGGDRFVQLMLTIATLVSQQYLMSLRGNRMGHKVQNWIHPMESHLQNHERFNSTILSSIQKLTQAKRRETAGKLKLFNAEVTLSRKQADAIVGGMSTVNSQLAAFSDQLDELTRDAVEKGGVKYVLNDVQVKELETISKKFAKLAELFSYLIDHGFSLTDNELPPTDREIISLLTYFELFYFNCEVKVYDVKRADWFTERRLQNVSKLITDNDALLTQCAALDKTMKSVLADLSQNENTLRNSTVQVIVAPTDYSDLFKLDL